VPVLSAFGRLAQRLLGAPREALIHDFHCGLRGVRRDDFLSLNTCGSGMEFASEMILAASAAGQHIVQTEAGLRPDLRRTGAPHLRALRDGLRHVRMILSFFPFGGRRR